MNPSRRGGRTGFVWAGALAACLAASPSARAAPPPGIKTELAFETSEFLKSAAYRNPDRVANEAADSGAYSPVNRQWDATHEGKWYIEEQRYAFDAVAAGLAYGRTDLIDRAKKIFDWGFRQERPDGGFDCPDSFHSASFFIEAAAHAALLLRAASDRPADREWVEAVTPKLKRAAAWMMDPKNEGPGRERDRPYTHRYYLDAAAIGEAGVLAGDKRMIEHSRDYIREGIVRQDPSGFNPEKGGSDTSYHAAGLTFALTYYELVADGETRTQLTPMMNRAIAWLRGRMRDDGTVDQAGNTRTGYGQEKGRNGTVKTMSYGSAYRAFYHWGLLTGDTSLEDDARLLVQGNEIEKKQRKAHMPP